MLRPFIQSGLAIAAAMSVLVGLDGALLSPAFAAGGVN